MADIYVCPDCNETNPCACPRIEVPVRHEIDGLEKAIQITQATECPPKIIHVERSPTRSRAFEAGFNVAKHVILQQLREEQNRRFKKKVIK